MEYLLFIVPPGKVEVEHQVRDVSDEESIERPSNQVVDNASPQLHQGDLGGEDPIAKSECQHVGDGAEHRKTVLLPHCYIRLLQNSKYPTKIC